MMIRSGENKKGSGEMCPKIKSDLPSVRKRTENELNAKKKLNKKKTIIIIIIP